ncbi:MAG TPA: YegS/Rv2252/BmrU family lipid kinase [Thermoanaerobaculia bacterium]|nr:YegS/Rv2252/BmrU family lipid kinase [Thermoanaerobaculia bacterium]
MKTLFLVNARSGANRRRDLTALIRETWEHEHEIFPCGSKEELVEVVHSAATRGVRIIYAVGGDGTVHEVAKRLVHTDLVLGILPAGSGNGLARHLCVPIEPRASLRACGVLRIETIDTATVNGTPFVNAMGVGFDAWVADAFATAGTRGMQTYVRAGLRGLATYEAEEYEVTIDGEMLRRSAIVIAVANASQYGNHARIAPLASVQDGLLDVTLIESVSLLRMPMLLARLFAGSLHRARGVTMFRGRTITIKRSSAGPAHLDGEPVTMPESLTIAIVPRSLKVIVPRAARAI